MKGPRDFLGPFCFGIEWKARIESAQIPRCAPDDKLVRRDDDATSAIEDGRTKFRSFTRNCGFRLDPFDNKQSAGLRRRRYTDFAAARRCSTETLAM
jgi:hypothetical protein